MAKWHKLTVISAVLILFCAAISYALEDGFGPAQKIESSYFDIYYSPAIEITDLTQRMNITQSDRILTGNIREEGLTLATGLAGMLDTLFLRVCDILDMHLYSFRGKLKICQNYNQLNTIYGKLFDKDLSEMRSFYVNDLNTIYISTQDFKREIIGHEMGHVIISHYFVVLPPVKIQEILATYVEYQLRKSGQ